MYQVWLTQGQGECWAADCETLEQAISYIEINKNNGSFAILYPNGEWHKWKE